MILNISKVSSMKLLFFLMLNYACAKTKSDIFSITGENQLWRKKEFALNNNHTTSNSSTIENETKLMNYLSLMSYELTELNEITEQSFKEDSISLPAAYAEISSDEIKFHDIIYDDFSNFIKCPVKLETIIPDGSDPNTIKIVYESKINEMILSGLAEINGTDYDFILNITEVNFKAEHERTPARAGGEIITKSIFETLNFKRFKVIIVVPGLNKVIEFPNKKIVRRLADSWMVTLVNVINIRFVQPRVRDQSQSYFEKYRNALLNDICSSILALSDTSTNFVYDPKKSLKLLGSSVYKQYNFEDITFSSFSKFTNFTSKSMSVRLVGNSPNEIFYSHNLFFVFTDNSAVKKSLHPFLKWTLKEITYDVYYYSYLDPKKWQTLEERYNIVIKYWSAIITIVTDKKGRPTGETKISIEIRPESYGEAIPNYWTNQFLNLFSMAMANDLKSLIDSTLLSKQN